MVTMVFLNDLSGCRGGELRVSRNMRAGEDPARRLQHLFW